MFDPTFNIGQIMQIGFFIVSGAGFVWMVKLDNAVMKTRLTFQDSQIAVMNNEIKKIGEILIANAHADGRVSRLEDRQLAEGKRLDELASRVNQT